MLFAAINLFQSWRLFVERRPVRLTEEEEHVRQLVFRDLPPRKFLQVLSLGAWRTAQAGEHLLERGKPAESVSLIVRGTVRVTRDERVLGELGAGEIVGSALILTGAAADVDAVAVEQVRSMRGTSAHWTVISRGILRHESWCKGTWPATWLES